MLGTQIPNISPEEMKRLKEQGWVCIKDACPRSVWASYEILVAPPRGGFWHRKTRGISEILQVGSIVTHWRILPQFLLFAGSSRDAKKCGALILCKCEGRTSDKEVALKHFKKIESSMDKVNSVLVFASSFSEEYATKESDILEA